MDWIKNKHKSFFKAEDVTVETDKLGKNIILKYYAMVSLSEIDNQITEMIEKDIREEMEAIFARELRPILTDLVARKLKKLR